MIEQIDAGAEDVDGVTSPSVGAVTSLLQNAVRRERFTDHDGRSGSRLEKVELADGTRLVVKHVSPKWDWIMRATGDRGRAAQLAASGMLGRVADVIDDAVLAVEPEGDGWVIAMRDVSEAMISLDAPVTRVDSLRVLRAAARLHEAFWGERIEGLVSHADRYALLSSRTAEQLGLRFGLIASRGWEVFTEMGPGNIVRATTTIMHRPELLARELDRHEQTLIHGDLKHQNIGLLPDRVILLDWALAGIAPPEVDFARYLMSNAPRSEQSLDELLADVHEVLGERFNARAMDLALIGIFVEWLPWLALSAAGERPWPPDLDQARAEARLAWWLQRIARALETWSPV